MQDPYIYNIAEICASLEIKDVILSPGSRCAPLTIAFNRHPAINIKTISDERSAAYIALGTALESKKPVALVCTSGTAAANYLPAVAEAFYQKVPLVIFTADRPPEWINQQDNQAIQQYNLFGKHVKESFQLPVDLSHADAKWHMTRSVCEAVNLSDEYPKGPVHINVPIREPFYPDKEQYITFDNIRITRVYQNNENKYHFSEELRTQLRKSKKILILAGQQKYSDELVSLLDTITKKGISIVGDIISNLHEVRDFISLHDLFLPNSINNNELSPDLLITFGDNILSKNLKQLIRKNKPVYHWHIQASGNVSDTFQCLTGIIRTTPINFFAAMAGEKYHGDKSFYNKWKTSNDNARKALLEYFSKTNDGELSVVNAFLKELPPDSNLHLANSMTVRYANLIGAPSKPSIHIYSNRGTSGIDGCNSTAVGVALSNPERKNFLITGDMAFLYDRNAFWNNYEIKNLKILVLNNSGGGIFRLIDGPASLPELDELFETKQKLTCEHLAKEHSFQYLKADSPEDAFQKIKYIQKLDYTCILEYFSEGNVNQKAFKEFKESIRKSLSGKV